MGELRQFRDVRSATIVEEVPGVEPHWFIRIEGAAQFPPLFETHKKAESFCEFMGWQHSTEYFET